MTSVQLWFEPYNVYRYLSCSYYQSSANECFPATKTDDLSCAEVIKGLGLQNNPDLELINNEIEGHRVQLNLWQSEKRKLQAQIKGFSDLCIGN